MNYHRERFGKLTFRAFSPSSEQMLGSFAIESLFSKRRQVLKFEILLFAVVVLALQPCYDIATAFMSLSHVEVNQIPIRLRSLYRRTTFRRNVFKRSFLLLFGFSLAAIYFEPCCNREKIKCYELLGALPQVR